MHLGLKQALYAPYSDAKSREPWSFTEVPEYPQIQTPNIMWIQKGAHIKSIRDASFPESSFICLSKIPENKPPPGSPATSKSTSLGSVHCSTRNILFRKHNTHNISNSKHHSFRYMTTHSQRMS
jgi:hypothetical protein